MPTKTRERPRGQVHRMFRMLTDPKLTATEDEPLACMLIWEKFEGRATKREFMTAMDMVARLPGKLVRLEQIDRVEPVAERTPRRRAKRVVGQLSFNLKGKL